MHSLRTWGCSENKDEGHGGGEVIDQATKYMFPVGKKKRFPVVAYENIAIRVANALGLPCFTVSKAFNESSNGMIYVLVLCINWCNYFQGTLHRRKII